MFGLKLGKLGALASRVAAAWSPLALWPNGASSPGLWIDPILLTASFNDSAGTTPVATPGTVADSANPVGLALDIRAGAPDTLGPELVDTLNTAAAWGAYGTNTIADDSGAVKVTYVDNDSGAYAYLSAATGLSANLVVAKRYVVSGEAKVSSGSVNLSVPVVTFGTATITSTTFISFSFQFVCVSVANDFLRADSMGAGEAIWLRNLSVREIPGNHMLQATAAARPLLSARVNLLNYSQGFSNAEWTKGDATVLSGYSDPQGGTAAFKIMETATTAAHNILQAKTIATSILFSAGVYLKAGERTWAQLVTATSGVTRIWVNLSTGALGTLENITAPEISVTDAGGGWWRVVFTKTSVNTNGELYVATADADGSNVYLGDPTKGIYAYGAQFNLGSVKAYQPILTDGSSYSPTGITPWQQYDGTDDGMATASFAAGTLTSAMDCMIAVRRNSAAAAVLVKAQDTSKCFGYFETAAPGAIFDGVGASVTVFVDSVQLAQMDGDGLAAALTVGEFHIVEFRGLDLSAWEKFSFSGFPGLLANCASGDIMLFESTASTEDKDKARQYLADKYGVTLA